MYNVVLDQLDIIGTLIDKKNTNEFTILNLEKKFEIWEYTYEWWPSALDGHKIDGYL